MSVLDSLKSYFQRNTPIDSEGVKMVVSGRVKNFLEETVLEGKGVKYSDLETEGLAALGFGESGNYTFLVGPTEIESIIGKPLNPMLREQTYVDLVSGAEINVSMIGLKDCKLSLAHLKRGHSRRLLPHDEIVYPIYARYEDVDFFTLLAGLFMGKRMI